jgi:hypothetical protein
VKDIRTDSSTHQFFGGRRISINLSLWSHTHIVKHIQESKQQLVIHNQRIFGPISCQDVQPSEVVLTLNQPSEPSGGCHDLAVA